MGSKQKDVLLDSKSFLLSMEMSDLGWDRTVYDLELTTGPQVILYCYDLLTNWVWMASLPRQSFIELSKKGFESPHETEAVRGGIATLIAQAAGNTAVKTDTTDNWEQQLGTLLSLYAGTTQTWDRANRFKDGGHFFVVNYRNVDDVLSTKLRPFALVDGKNVALPPAELARILRKVVSDDQLAHPDWFTLLCISFPFFIPLAVHGPSLCHAA